MSYSDVHAIILPPMALLLRPLYEHTQPTIALFALTKG